MAYKKLIEVALPLEAINAASAREKSIRHGHPSTLHLWWARRPLAAARAVIFASLVDDPDDPAAPPDYVAACRALPKGPNVHASGDTPRMRLFDFLERLVTWEATSDEALLAQARALIQLSNPQGVPPLLDPFAGGGSIPLEAQRLGLEAHASDLNPVAVMINKAQIEIPPRFANQPPVNPRDREKMFGDDGGRGMMRRGMMHHAPTEPSNSLWKGAAGLAADVRYYGEWMREKAWARIGHLYPTLSRNPAGERGETVIAWLWARTVKSPNPAVNAHVPLVRSFVLSKRKGRECWARPVVASIAGEGMESHAIRFEVTPGLPPKGQDGTMSRGNAVCIVSGEPITGSYIRNESYEGRMGAMLMAIVTEGAKGRSYYSPDEWHENVARSATPKWKPTQEMNRNTPDLVSGRGYGFFTWADLFTPRQLVALTTFSDLVGEARQQAYQDALAAGLPDDDVPLREGGRGARAYAEAISVYLAFAVDKVSNYWSSLCSWHSGRDTVTSTFGRQALPMVWDFTEANPFSDSSGNFLGQLEYMLEVVERLPAYPSGHVWQQDAIQIDLPARTLSTDPPYYDAIGYADLSDFFYVWLRPALRAVYPDLFSTLLVPKAAELIASPHRHGGKEAAKRHFEDGLRQTFANIRRFVSPDYPLTVYYAFKQQEAEDFTPDPSALTPDPSPIQGRGEEESPSPLVGEGFRVRGSEEVRASSGWETMLTSLIEADFTIDGTWPMRTELTGNLKKNVNALASSIVLVCRPRPADAPPASRRTFLDALRRELPTALRDLQSGSIAPVDLAQAAIGPGMAIYSRYSRVVEADGTPLTVRTALALINAALDEFLAEQDGDLDAETRFAVAWFEQFAFNETEFGRADDLARAKNVSVDGLKAAGLMVAERGRARLIHWKEYALTPGPSPTRGEGLPNAPASTRGDAPSPVTRRGGKGGEGWDPTKDERLTVWEATHHLIDRLHRSGEAGSGELLQLLPPDVAAEARQLAYRLYSICERKGWAEHARDYNALVLSWSGISEEATRLRQAAVERINTQQRPLFKDE